MHSLDVNSLGDSGAAGVCELRSAISAAETDLPVAGCDPGSGADEIVFSVTGTINLNSTLPFVNETLEINGPGQLELTISGQGAYNPFVFFAAGTIRNLTVANGYATTNGGCLYSAPPFAMVFEDVEFYKCATTASGGALAISGPLTIRRSTFSKNVAENAGGAIAMGNTIEISDSTFYANSGENGGALNLNATGTTLISNSTFHANQAQDAAGAIWLISRDPGIIISSTITGNVADKDGDGVGNGGGVYLVNGTLTLENSIVSGNIATGLPINHPDISKGGSATLNSNGYNFIGNNISADATFPAGMPNASNDFAGTDGAPIDAMLEPIGPYGGPTATMPPLTNSPVLDQGNCPALVADQRGVSNLVTGMRAQPRSNLFPADGCDIGAVELPGFLIWADGFESEVEF